MTEAYPVLTLIPPVLAIALVITTKKVIMSLAAGVISAEFLI